MNTSYTVVTQPQQHAQATNAGAQDHAQNAASIRQSVSPSYVEAIRTNREVGSQFQDGCVTRSGAQPCCLPARHWRHPCWCSVRVSVFLQKFRQPAL